jgi:hypothetical protein
VGDPASGRPVAARGPVGRGDACHEGATRLPRRAIRVVPPDERVRAVRGVRDLQDRSPLDRVELAVPHAVARDQSLEPASSRGGNGSGSSSSLSSLTKRASPRRRVWTAPSRPEHTSNCVLPGRRTFRHARRTMQPTCRERAGTTVCDARRGAWSRPSTARLEGHAAGQLEGFEWAVRRRGTRDL